MPKVLGDVAIVIRPSTVGFRQLADAQLRKDLAGFRPQVQIGADTKMARVAVADLKARMDALRVSLKGMRADVNTKAGEARIAALQARLSLLVKNMHDIAMSADTRKLDAQIAGEIAKLRTLQQRYGKLQLNADATKALARIAELELAESRLEKRLRTMKGDLNIAAARTKLAAIGAELKALNSDKNTLRLKADKKAALADIAVVEASITRLRAEAADIKLNANAKGLLAAQAGLLGIESAVEKLKTDAPVAAKGMGVFFAASGRASTASAAGWKILTGHLTLFGGALNNVLPKMFTSVAVWHLLADAVIELVAVWVPAIIAVTAFGVAGADAAKKIYNRMLAVHTVMDATNQAVPPLHNNFKNLAAAVRPEVYQLFGDALVIMSKRGNAFNQVAIGTGHILDQLAARFVVAVTSGSGVNKFMEHATTDVAKLGDSIGNFGGIFGAVFRAVPGYAEILLTVGDAITKVLEAATRVAEPVIAFGLALHGFFIYGGAAVTMSLALVAGLVKIGSAFGKFNTAITLTGFNALNKFRLAIAGGIANLVTYSAMLVEVAGAEGVAAARTIVLSDAMSLLSKVPIMVWVTLAATLIAGLAIAIGRSRDEAQKFNSSMQDLIANAPVGNLIATIQGAQATTATRLASATSKLNAAIKTNVTVNAGRAGALNSNGAAIQNLDNKQRHYTEGLITLTDQQKLVNTRVGILSKTYGGNAQALGALSAAGITSQQLTAKGANAWDIIKVQVEATTQAYAAMGTQAGVLGNDLDALGRTVTDQYKAVQTLNQGWSAFIADVTGTQGSFDTVAQGFLTLNDHAGKLHFSLGKLKVAYNDANVAIDSLSPAGLALNQAFGEQIVNTDKLFASWRTAGLAGNLFTQGVKDSIAPLVKYAAGSQEATAQLIALAQEAGYQGPISMAALTKWLGNTHGATQKLKDITNQATAQEALLTGAMRSQGSFIANQLINDINNAILHYNGVEKAAAAYGDAIAKSGRQSDAAKHARDVLVADIIKAGVAAGDSKGQIAAMIAKVLGIPPKAAMQLVMTGTGSFSLSQINAKTGKQQQAATGGYLNMAGRLMRADGGFIHMGSGPTADDVPIMASRGEYVVKASSVAKYGKPVMDQINAGAYAGGGIIPRFASGGVLLPHVSNMIPQGDTSVLTGQYAVNKYDDFKARFQAAMVAQMRSSLHAAITAAQSAASAAGAAGPPGSGVQRWRGTVQQALRMAGANVAQLTDPVLYQMTTESGGNQFAVNKTDSNWLAGHPSVGLMQVIHGTYAAYGAGRMGYPPPVAYGVSEQGLANIYSAIKYAQTTYGPGLRNAYGGIGTGHGYAQGGLIPGMAAGGTVSGLRSRLAAEEGSEQSKYSGLVHSFLAGPAKYRTHTVMGELGTLAARQRTEQDAYRALAGKGLTSPRLHHLGATARSEITTASDKGLSKMPGGHPLFARDLRNYLGQISMTSQGNVPAGSLTAPAPAASGAPSGNVAKQGSAWLKAWQTRHGGGYGAAWGPVVVNQQVENMQAAQRRALTLSKAPGLTSGKHRFWASAAADEGKRLAVLKREVNVERSYRNMLGSSDNALAADIRAAGNIPSLAKNVRAWKSQITRQKATITAISKMLGYSSSQIAAMIKAGKLGPGGKPLPKVTHTYGGDVSDTIGAFLHSVVAPFARGGRASSLARGGMASFDSGGTLVPGANAVWNGTGANEHLVPAGQACQVEVVLSWAGDAPAEVVRMLRKHVRTTGGNVQRALGQQGTVSGGANWKMGWSS